ncbi:alpha/beta hydrolase [Actinoplanes sp. M2I2]|uniref:alpha/beta hydrolase n=1 Tax=Actinoplanes sp. M2I2 TaxID=1734444 RepID=UPI00201FDF46|nr:alpha/beta hydrolase [Actinoplanes sp. M2I2]
MKRPARRFAGLGLMAGVLVVAACTSGSGEQPAADPSASTAALDRFYAQKLEWRACNDDFATSKREAEVLAKAPAECGWLTVPLDYADPGGEAAAVAVLRVKARGKAQGSLLLNSGGPGGSGVLFGVAVGTLLPESRITERFDLIGFDPRGVGATKPAADCYSEKGTTRGDKVFPLVAQNAPLTEEDTRAVLDRCAAGSGGAKALTQMGTRTTARDMDVLRAALGEEKLTFLGQSYGTRLGTAYAEQFPQRVRAMVLDGGFDPRQGTVERRLLAYGGFQQAFTAMAAACAKDATCPLGTDPKAWTSKFQAIVQPLLDRPVPAGDRKLTFDDALGGVINGLYDPAKWPTVVGGLEQVRQGRGDKLLELLAENEGGEADTVVNGNQTEAAFAINCMDEQRLTPQDVIRLRTETYELAPFMNPGNDLAEGARDACEFWPAQPTLGIPYGQNIAGLPKTLVVSITGDPTAPHKGSISLAETLDSALLTVKGEGHTIVSSGANKCVDTIASDYLVDLKLPATMPTCTK